MRDMDIRTTGGGALRRLLDFALGAEAGVPGMEVGPDESEGGAKTRGAEAQPPPRDARHGPGEGDPPEVDVSTQVC